MVFPTRLENTCVAKTTSAVALVVKYDNNRTMLRCPNCLIGSAFTDLRDDDAVLVAISKVVEVHFSNRQTPMTLSKMYFGVMGFPSHIN